MGRVGLNRICTPYMNVCMVMSLLIILYVCTPYIRLIIWLWPTLAMGENARTCLTHPTICVSLYLARCMTLFKLAKQLRPFIRECSRLMSRAVRKLGGVN